ncbi:MAG: hypothetical protein KIS67_28910 [Verrucomicrobiae bacterium]|nr:hypothetical protein [Verrucomicrobiae bacterium]
MKYYLPILVLLAVPAVAHCAWFTNSASADSFVRAAAPDLNYGGAGALAVSGADAVNGSGVANGAFDSFIRFNTAAMVTHFDSLFGTGHWAVNGANLRVTEVAAPNNALFNRGVGTFEIRWIANDNWVEGTGNPNAPATTGIVYNDKAALLDSGADASLGVFTNAGLDGAITFPLALPEAFVNDAQAGGEVGLYLTAIDPGIGFTFDSRSFGTVAARPFLIVSAIPVPVISAINVSGANVTLSVRNASADETYSVLSSADVALPLSQWLPVAADVLSVGGDFEITLTNAVNGLSRQFFIIQTQ